MRAGARRQNHRARAGSAQGSDFALQRLMPKLGLVPAKMCNCSRTGISESDRRMLMLLQGKIDATLGTEDNLLQLANRGMKFSVLADLYDSV